MSLLDVARELERTATTTRQDGRYFEERLTELRTIYGPTCAVCGCCIGTGQPRTKWGRWRFAHLACVGESHEEGNV